MPRTSLMMRDRDPPEQVVGSGTQSAVMPSCEVTARIAQHSS
jgi:hypothetical protein